MKGFNVINSQGEKELFSLEKVARSAQRVGASLPLAESIAQEIAKNGYEGMPTFKIFQQVKKRLNKSNLSFGLKFNLKQAMKDLGPDGFRFEKFIASIMQNMGYEVFLNQFISGRCLRDYEIDFVAEKESILKIGECKYFNQSGLSVDQSVALANAARFVDIEQGSFGQEKAKENIRIKSILITNGRFSSRAIAYSNCVGIELWGWKYPANNGLEKFIDEGKLYPITILPSFQRKWADFFNQHGIILAKDLLSVSLDDFFAQSRFDLNKLKNLVKEAKSLIES